MLKLFMLVYNINSMSFTLSKYMQVEKFPTYIKLCIILLGFCFDILSGALAIKFTWGWVVSDIFSQFVTQDFLPEVLTFLQSFKLSLFIWVLGLTAKND